MRAKSPVVIVMVTDLSCQQWRRAILKTARRATDGELSFVSVAKSASFVEDLEQSAVTHVTARVKYGITKMALVAGGTKIHVPNVAATAF